MITINEQLYQKHVLENPLPVLVEFWAPWCVYCRRIVPALEKVAQQREGSMIVAKINIDEEPALAEKERIEVVPTLILYQNGQALGSLVAPESKAGIDEFIADTLGE